MGRGRVELKRIENKINRQVTFSKRRNGLLKKAYELSVLCDVEVAAIIFSNRGRLFEFCSTSSMLETIERYQKCSYNASDAIVPPKETQVSNSYHEYLKLKARVEFLQRSQRNLLGEDLGPLSVKELEQLDNQIEISLKHIRSTKTQLMLDQLCDVKRKEQMLQEANKALRRKLEEGTNNPLQLSWQNGANDVGNAPCGGEPPQSQGFFQPLGCEPSLQIGYHPVCIDQLNTEAAATQNVNGYFPWWI
ncbi:agamous-like MADS-box protein MADS2 isoform X2 [Phoenix dactylifera]|uniref:Agamous-like MADS-box protein MADS2 isoform X2 n=1 Tax=Phoenix dactylifera TaxID=42345 RepID=A0A8B7D123_PHODC|nr:agamous-like MADS-box protein MADS2 isoform X2 [Phoenix dactylifera]